MNSWENSPTNPDTGGMPPDFPPPPWRMSGTMTLGLFPLAERVAVQSGLTALLSQRLLVGTIRYHGGIRYLGDDLRYDLLMIASLARHRHRVGLHLHKVWVNSRPIQQVTAALWGVPIDLADFSWSGRKVLITADDDIALTLAVHPRTRIPVPLITPVPCFGLHEGHLVYINVLIRTPAQPTTLQLLNWPEQLPALRDLTSSGALELQRFRMKVPPSRNLALS